MLPDGMVPALQSVIIVGSPAVMGLWVANILYDHDVPHYLSRKAGHAAAGFTFLASVLLLPSALWAIMLSVIFGTLLLGARFLRPATFRGVGGSARSNAFSEVWFAWVVVPVVGTGWLWLEQPLVTLACLLYMAWGDCITGLVRARIYHTPVKGLWGLRRNGRRLPRNLLVLAAACMGRGTWRFHRYRCRVGFRGCGRFQVGG